MAGIVRGDGLFASEFAFAINRKRIGLIEFVVRPIAETIEDVIGRDVDKWEAAIFGRNGQIARPNGVEFVRACLICLRAVNVGVGCCVDHDVRLMRSYSFARVVKSRDVKARVSERDQFVICQYRLQRAAKLSARACDQHSHSNSSSTGKEGVRGKFMNQIKTYIFLPAIFLL
jgi:hypothetical protein